MSPGTGPGLPETDGTAGPQRRPLALRRPPPPMAVLAPLASRVAGRLVRTVVGQQVPHSERVMDTATEEARALGVHVTEVLKHRSRDDKVVLRCEDDDGRPLVFKYVSRQAGRGTAEAHGATLRLAHNDSQGLFPRCHQLGVHWSLEEWVDGKPLKRFGGSEWDRVDLVDFLGRLHRFSRGNRVDTTALGGPELEVILEKYLRRAFKYVGYHGPLGQLRSAATLYRNRRRIAEPVRAFRSAAAGARLEPYCSIDDLNDANVVFSPGVERPLIIDVEDVKPGVLGFDCVWLLTTMARGTCPLEDLVAAYRVVTSEDYLDGPAEVLLSRLLFHILLTSDTLTLNRRSPSTSALLEVVTGDLAGVLPR